MFCASRTAKDLTAGFHAVTDHAATAMRTSRRQRVNRALEGIKYMLSATVNDLETLVVVITTDFAFHNCVLRRKLDNSAAGMAELS